MKSKSNDRLIALIIAALAFYFIYWRPHQQEKRTNEALEQYWNGIATGAYLQSQSQ